MLPPAPGLFSITTDWPQTSCRRLPTRRAVVSVEPPGVKGTMMCTGLAGQATLAAKAREAAMEGAARLAAASPTKRRRSSMGAPPLATVIARLPRVVSEWGVWRAAAWKSMRRRRQPARPGGLVVRDGATRLLT